MTGRGVHGVAAALLLLTGPLCTGCSTGGARPAAPVSTPVAALPTSPDGLERLLLTRVPSGLPRVPDGELQPAAGRKTVDDVAGYAPDPQRQRQVLDDYGYRWGWERFWRAGNALTSVFLDQFDRAAGAGTYAEDLAGNEEQRYGGELDRMPADLPAGCAVLSVDAPDPATGLTGPAALAWCSQGGFSLAVAAVSGSPQRARDELTAVVREQLDRLPEG